MTGGAGNDRMYVDAADTLVDGGAGNDRVHVQGAAGVTLDMTAASVETAVGNAGDDSFDATGMAAATRQYGRGGDDTLTGGSRADRLYGDAGADSRGGRRGQ